MTHQFDIEIAERVGVNAAIIYSNIEFWCAKNKANNKNFFDGNYWTYNSVKAWTELFPYFSIKVVRTALEKLEKEEFIQSGNYNKAGYDRTKWYSINVTLGNMDLPSEANGVVHKGKPIPDNKPDTKNFTSEIFSLEELEQVIAYRKSIKSPLKTQQGITLLSNKFKECYEHGYTFADLFNLMCGKEWKSLELDWVVKSITPSNAKKEFFYE